MLMAKATLLRMRRMGSTDCVTQDTQGAYLCQDGYGMYGVTYGGVSNSHLPKIF